MTKFFDSSRSIFARIRLCLQVLALDCQTENDVLDPALQQFYPSSSSHSSSGCLRSLIALCVDVFEQDLFMLPFVWFESEEKPLMLWECFLLYYNYRQRNFGPHYVLMHLETLIEVSIRERCLPLAVTTECTAEKWLEHRVQIEHTPKQMAENADRRSSPKQRKAVETTTATTSITLRLYIQPMNIVKN